MDTTKIDDISKLDLNNLDINKMDMGGIMGYYKRSKTYNRHTYTFYWI